MNAGDVMTTAVVTVGPQAPVTEIVTLLLRHGISAVPVVRSHAKVAADVMTRDVVCVGPGTSLDAIADLMEAHSIKRVPVVQERRLVGIVSRANLLRAFAALPEGPCAAASDTEIRAALSRELAQQPWSRRADNSVVVTGGVVHLWGMVTSREESRALELAAQSVPGVRDVQNHTVVLSETTYPVYPGSFVG